LYVVRLVNQLSLDWNYMPERLHKLLAQHGLGSRREIEKWMLAGRVILNSKPAQPGDRYADGDRVIVDGKDVTSRLLVSTTTQVVAYHKPQGQPVETRNNGYAQSGDVVDTAIETVLERLPAVRGARWLAINTMQAGDSGLLLMTTDGHLADALRRRSESISAAYVARVLVTDPDFDLAAVSKVVRYDEETVEFEAIEDVGGEGTNRWFRIDAPRAHRRAAVRALFESRGLGVSRVVQVKFGPLELARDLPRGKHRALTPVQIRELYELAGLQAPVLERTSASHQRRDRHQHAAPSKRVARGAATDSRRPGR
jgi:23S rRNA pseudouridine2605 synthase